MNSVLYVCVMSMRAMPSVYDEIEAVFCLCLHLETVTIRSVYFDHYFNFMMFKERKKHFISRIRFISRRYHHKHWSQ